MQYIHETNAVFEAVTNFIADMISTRNPTVYRLNLIEQTYNGMIEKRWILAYCSQEIVREFIRLCQLSNSTYYCSMHTLQASKLLLPWSDRGSLVTWLSANKPDALPWQEVVDINDMVSYFTDTTIIIMPYEPMDIDENLYMDFDIQYEEVRRLVSQTYFQAGLMHRLDQEGDLFDQYAGKLPVFDSANKVFVTPE